MKTMILPLLTLTLTLPAFAAGMSDAEIAHAVITANATEVSAAKIAAEKAQSPDVKKFARMMLTDHKDASQQASALAKKLALSPKDNEISRGLRKDAEDETGKLQSAQGAAFDRAYIDNEVDDHQKVLDTIDKKLLPDAKNPMLKALIAKIRPVIAEHLDFAKKVQAGLEQKGTARQKDQNM